MPKFSIIGSKVALSLILRVTILSLPTYLFAASITLGSMSKAGSEVGLPVKFILSSKCSSASTIS